MNTSAESSETFTFTLDGAPITAREGQTILEAAAEAGVYIPTLCHRDDLTPAGHCRICTVMVNGRPASACTLPATPGIVVENQTAELNNMRRCVVEMLFVEGNHVCPSCEASGNCELQALGYRLGMTAPQYPYLAPSRELDATHPDILIDRNRCVLCGRCARAAEQLDGKSVFAFENRGIDMRIAVNADNGLAGTNITVDDAAVDACPVGCILVKRRGYRDPIGTRAYDREPIGSAIEARHPAEPQATGV